MTITSDSVLLITGASSGIGRALALALARHGVCTALMARNRQALEQVVAEANRLGGESVIVGGDVTVRSQFEAAVEQTVAHFGQLDALVNNAGRGNRAYITDTPDQQIENIFRVNVYALWYGTAAALKHMLPRRSGIILNMGSMAGVMGFPANAAYVAAKHAVVGFTRALRAELAGTGVEAMVVNPGGVLTNYAQATEGGPIGDLFAYEATRGQQIAAQTGAPPFHNLPLLRAEQVADSIVEALQNPQPEWYTHPGSHELLRSFQHDQLAVEHQLLPYWLANREGYYDL